MKGTLEAAGIAHFKPGDFTVSQFLVACKQALQSGMAMGQRESGKKRGDRKRREWREREVRSTIPLLRSALGHFTLSQFLLDP